MLHLAQQCGINRIGSAQSCKHIMREKKLSVQGLDLSQLLHGVYFSSCANFHSRHQGYHQTQWSLRCKDFPWRRAVACTRAQENAWFRTMKNTFYLKHWSVVIDANDSKLNGLII